MTRTDLHAALTATRTAKVALSEARGNLDSLIRRRKEDRRLVASTQIDNAWNEVERRMIAFREAKAAYHAACAA